MNVLLSLMSLFFASCNYERLAVVVETNHEQKGDYAESI
jgi:hypothetical protein